MLDLWIRNSHGVSAGSAVEELLLRLADFELTTLP
jgi:hypothetical protein